MDQIYSAANSASRAVFGDPSANPNRTGAPDTATATATDTAPQHSGTNPFRSATTTAEPADLHHAAGTGGSGTRHTAGSTRPTTTTTSMLEKPLAGDLNKDGMRYDTADTHRPFGTAIRSEERPTISDTGIIPGTHPTQKPLEAAAYQTHGTNNEHFGVQPPNPVSAFPSTTGVSQKLGSGIPDTHDWAHGTHGQQLGSTAQPHTHGSNDLSGTRDRAHEHQQFGSNLTGSGTRDQQQPGSNLHGTHDRQLGSTTQHTHGSTDLPGTRDRQQPGSNIHGTLDQQLGSTTQHTHGSTDLPGTRDRAHEHQQFGSNLTGSGTRDQQQPGSNLHGTHDRQLGSTTQHTHGSTDLPGTRDRQQPGSNIHGTLDQQLGSTTQHTHGPTDLPGTRDRSTLPSSSAHNHNHNHDHDHGHDPSTTKHQLPIGGHPHTKSTESGTGEKYEKSTGVAADGGDFDASRPGAGREADRLLDERGIHHGADKKKDVAETEKGNSALKAVPGEQENRSEHKSEHKGTEEHKGLGEKIKEKLHLGHH